jgi:hypothetical protein
MAIVYQHIRKDNNQVFYVGIGKSEKRAYDKIRRYKPWKDLTKNHDFYVEITHRDICWEEACVIEQYLIAFYGRRDLGTGCLVNMTDGGDGTKNLSQESRNKMAVNKGKFRELNYFYGKKHEGDLSRFGKQNIGRPSWIKGKKHSKESIEKMSVNRSGKKLTEEHKKKLGDAIRGKRLGENNPMFGKPAINRKRVQHIETQLIFNSAIEASNYFNVSASTITRWIKENKFNILN